MRMTIEQAIKQVESRFPFENYLEHQADGQYSVAETILRHLPAGATILDFGSGPCDRTAVAQVLGYKCSAADDLNDEWHRAGGNREKIIAFAKQEGINFELTAGNQLPFSGETFDMVMLHDVLEHLHDSPRDLLNDLLTLLKPGGLLFVTVPSAVNIRKRLDVLRGKTNLPNYEAYYWSPGPWRGHVREYTRGDLQMLAAFLALEVVELKNCHHMLHRLSPRLRPIYRAVTALFPGWSDSLSLVARKPMNWQPRKTLPEEELRRMYAAIPNFSNYLYK